MLTSNDGTDADMAAAYERHFNALAQLAVQMNIPPEEAEEIISNVLLSALSGRPIADIDTWLAAAFTSTVESRKERG
jgi:DNA-directed RNA polymerase specialized sigma24 family protein